MKKIITLDEFLQMNGNVSKLDLKQSKTTYYDKNEGKEIIKIEETSSNKNSRLFNVTFINGVVHRYASSWISVSIDLVLDSKYL